MDCTLSFKQFYHQIPVLYTYEYNCNKLRAKKIRMQEKKRLCMYMQILHYPSIPRFDIHQSIVLYVLLWGYEYEYPSLSSWALAQWMQVVYMYEQNGTNLW